MNHSASFNPMIAASLAADDLEKRMAAPVDRRADLTPELVAVLARVAFDPRAIGPDALMASESALELLKARLPVATVRALEAGKRGPDLHSRIEADLLISRHG